MAEIEDFPARYGPWALIAGASEGVGAAYARAVAERGVNVVLLARRQAVLDEVAAGIRADTGVEVRTLVADLAEPSAAGAVAAATADLEVGLLMYNAGSDPTYAPFLTTEVAAAERLIHRNCVVPTQLCHHFGQAMAARGRGGIILVTSAGGLAGAPNMAAYGGTKAFDMVFAESLWTELKPQGVDVLSLVLGETDTPALRRLRAARGEVDDPDQPLPGAATVDEVVADAIAKLPEGPSWIVGEQLRAGLAYLGSVPRNQAVGLMVKASRAAMSAQGA